MYEGLYKYIWFDLIRFDFDLILICGVYSLKWSYGQILQSPLLRFQIKSNQILFVTYTWFAAPSVLSLVSLLPLWLINALLAWSVIFDGRPSLGMFVVVPYSFHFLIMDLTVLLRMFKVSDIFFITQPWSVLLHNFVPDLFGELLGLGAACLVVLLA